MKAFLGILAAPIKWLFTLLGAPFKRLPFCSLPGALVGSFAGFIMTLFQLENPTMVLSASQLLIIALLIAGTGLLLVLLLYGGLLKYGVAAIFPAAAANAIITSILVVFITWWMQSPTSASVIGLLIGVFVGAILCWLCRFEAWRSYAKT